MNARLIRSRSVAPMARPGGIIDDGAVAVADGRIIAVGRFVDLRRDFALHQIEDAGECVLLPGLVNAHTHLELSDCTPGDRPAGGLEQWLTGMLSRTRIEAEELERRSAHAAQIGAQQCLRFGVTTVGDISRQCHVTRPVLRDGPLRVVSFGEVMAMAQRRTLLETRLELAADETHVSEHLRIGISPHSPYSIEPEGFRRCLDIARRRHMPLATHLAETRSEWEFLASHTGPLKDLWDSWLTWDDHVPRYAGGPIALANELGLLDYGATLAHVNYCNDSELALLARGKSSIVYCPRTHEYFGHPPHRFREMLAAGINVAAGTDSCASSPNLNLVDDLRLILRHHPDLAPELIWRMATTNAAKALGLADHVGQFTPGACADLIAFPAKSDPLREVLDTPLLPAAVWVGAVRM